MIKKIEFYVDSKSEAKTEKILYRLSESTYNKLMQHKKALGISDNSNMINYVIMKFLYEMEVSGE